MKWNWEGCVATAEDKRARKTQRRNLNVIKKKEKIKDREKPQGGRDEPSMRRELPVTDFAKRDGRHSEQITKTEWPTPNVPRKSGFR